MLDFTAAFREASPTELFEGELDFHWNAAGETLAARTASSEMIGRGLLAR